MSHPLFRGASKVVHPARHSTPAAFFHQCRTNATETFQGEHASTAAWRASSSLRTRSTHPTIASKVISSSTRPCAVKSRSFSTTSPYSATVIAQNPRVDEEGQDMTIEISARAAKRLQQITYASSSSSATPPKKGPQHSHLRVTVTSGGCHGFQYLMSLEDASKVDPEEDTIFVAAEDTGAGKAEVVMDSASLELLKGSTIDFTTELIGSQFKIVGNPRAKSSCGCGTSFDID